MSEWDDDEDTGVKDLKAIAARSGVLELVDAQVREMLRKYNEDED